MTEKSADRGEARPAVARRRFVNGFLGISFTALAASVAYPVLRFLSPPRIPEAAQDRVAAGKVAEMSQKRWKLFPFGPEPGLLVEAAPGEYKAFAATCTHLECTVQFHKESRRIWCPCHNGWYDLSGRVVEGPPPAPLEEYAVEVVGEDIFVHRT